jgi:hypothetical protein
VLGIQVLAIANFGFRQPSLREGGVVWQDEEGCNAEGDRQDALEDEDPAPAQVPTNAAIAPVRLNSIGKNQSREIGVSPDSCSLVYVPHLGDACSHQATERSGHCGSAIEERHSELSLPRCVPLRDQEHCPWKESSLKDAEDEATRNKSAEVLAESGASHHDTPGRGDKAEPGGGPLKQDQDTVRRHFAKNIRHKENHVGYVVVGSFHVEVFLESFDLGVADICSIQIGNQIQCLFDKVLISTLCGQVEGTGVRDQGRCLDQLQQEVVLARKTMLKSPKTTVQGVLTASIGMSRISIFLNIFLCWSGGSS